MTRLMNGSNGSQYVEASLEVFVVDPPPTYSPIVSREGNDALQARDD